MLRRRRRDRHHAGLNAVLQATNRGRIPGAIVQQFIKSVTFDLVAPDLDRQAQGQLGPWQVLVVSVTVRVAVGGALGCLQVDFVGRQLRRATLPRREGMPRIEHKRHAEICGNGHAIPRQCHRRGGSGWIAGARPLPLEAADLATNVDGFRYALARSGEDDARPDSPGEDAWVSARPPRWPGRRTGSPHRPGFHRARAPAGRSQRR